MKTILLSICLLPFIGCMSVPETTITFNRTTTGFELHSPKDIELTGTRIVIDTDGSIDVTIEQCKSHNNIEVIKAVIEGNAAARASLEKDAATILGTVVKTAK